jgi:hypothetical protein
VRRQVDGRFLLRVGANALVGQPFGGLIGADGVHDSAQRRVLRIRAVSREKDRVVAVLDDNGELAARATGGVARRQR